MASKMIGAPKPSPAKWMSWVAPRVVVTAPVEPMTETAPGKRAGWTGAGAENTMVRHKTAKQKIATGFI